MNLNYLDIAIKLTLGLLSLVVVINLTGKGNLAPTSASDQVQNYVLGGIIGGVIYNPAISILQFFIILLIWFALVLSLKWLKTNNERVKRTLDGQPVTVIKNGTIDVEAVRKAGLTAQDLAFKLRSANLYKLSEIKRAVLEQNGQLFIVAYGETNPKYPVITDGHIQTNTLESIDKTEEWLLDLLAQKGYHDPSRIFLAEFDGGKLNVFEY